MTRRIGIHKSVGELFPPERFERAFESDGTATGADERERTDGEKPIVETVGGNPEVLSALDV